MDACGLRALIANTVKNRVNAFFTKGCDTGRSSESGGI